MKKIYLIRHGETAWTLSGQHTSITDIPLTEKGIQQAHLLAKRLERHPFEKVLVSPMQRAKQTCYLTGFETQAIVDPRLVEWDYGKYEGITSNEIHQKHPKWNVFFHGAPGGESVQDIQHRTTQVIRECEKADGNVALFSHGHFLRALTMTFIQLAIAEGRHFSLSPGSISILGHENNFHAISTWNDVSHLIYSNL